MTRENTKLTVGGGVVGEVVGEAVVGEVVGLTLGDLEGLDVGFGEREEILDK